MLLNNSIAQMNGNTKNRIISINVFDTIKAFSSDAGCYILGGFTKFNLDLLFLNG